MPIGLPPESPELLARIHDLIGCAWGRYISAPNDDKPCTKQAEQIVVLHNGDAEMAVKLCAHHVEVVKTLTDPHKEASDGNGEA